jgi:hypothetical protein
VSVLRGRLVCMSPHSSTTLPASESIFDIEERIEVYAAAARHYPVAATIWVGDIGFDPVTS